MPISSVVPSLDGPVLTVLAGTTGPVGLAEIHRRAGRGSKSGVRQVLMRMVEDGLVSEVPGGFVLNRMHLAMPAVEILADMHGELVRRIRSLVDNLGADISLVGLFGSAARRDGNTASDIDVLVVSDAKDLDGFSDRLAGEIRSWTGNRAQVIAISNAELRRLQEAEESIVANWDQDLVVVCGDRRALRSMV
ncbi:MAG: nucleotidyltransferase domain-containing protein [Ilumatobacteraceae bacterium]